MGGGFVEKHLVSTHRTEYVCNFEIWGGAGEGERDPEKYKHCFSRPLTFLTCCYSLSLLQISSREFRKDSCCMV